MGMNKVVIDVEARFNDGISGPARAAAKAVDEIGKSAKAAQARLDAVKKKPYKPVFDADNSKFLKKIQAMENKARSLGHKKTSVVLEAVDKASNIIGKVMNTAQKFGRGTHKAVLTVKSVGLNVIHKTLTGLQSITRRAWTATLRVKDFVTSPLRRLKDSLFSIKTLIAAIAGGVAMKKLAIEPTQMYANYEDLVTQFSVLLGDQDAARKRMSSLVEFAGKTPFTRDEIFQASRILQTYTNGALATPEATGGLKMIGDVAAATGEEYTRVANYFGRLYNEVARGGKSLGEPLMMLREIGALSAENEEAITNIAQGSGTIEEKWAQIAQQFSKTDGMMEAMSDQMNNLILGVKSFFKNNVLMKLGEGISASLKPFLSDFRRWRSENSAAIAEWATKIRDTAEIISGKILNGVRAIASKVQEITKTPEWAEAGIGGKAKLLWKGLVTDPLTEWWNNGGREKTIRAAAKIGGELGHILSSALLGLFRGIAGLTSEAGGLADAGLDAGASVAGAFVQGFLANFDGGAIVGAFKDAVTGIWDILPWWGKALAAGFIGSKVIGGATSLFGGLKGLIGSAGTVTAAEGAVGQAGLLGMGFKVGSMLPVAGATESALLTSLVGLGTVAGGVTTGIGAIHAVNSLAKANEQFTNGDTRGGAANSVRGLGTIAGGVGGALAGAKLGATIGALAGPAGILIGAGLGTAVGWFASDKIAKHIEAAKFESQEMRDAIKSGKLSAEELDRTLQKVKQKDLKEHFGDIALSLSEVQSWAKQTVFGDLAEQYEKFGTATEEAASNLAKLKNAKESTDKILWKASVGYQFTENDKESIISSFDNYIQSAKDYAESKHYEWTAAVSVLIDPQSEEGKGILESGNQFYNWVNSYLADLGSQLSEKLQGTIKLEGGVLTLDMDEEILNLQNQIQEITNALNQANLDAQSESIQLRYGSGQLLNSSSYGMYQQEITSQVQSEYTAAQDALEKGLATGRLRLSLGDPHFSQDDYKHYSDTLWQGFQANMAASRDRIIQSAVGPMEAAYPEVAGRLSNALQTALNSNTDPIDWDIDTTRLNLGLPDGFDQAKLSIFQDWLSWAFQTVAPLDVDIPVDPNYDVADGSGNGEVGIRGIIQKRLGLLADQIGSQDVTVPVNETLVPGEVNTDQLTEKTGAGSPNGYLPGFREINVETVVNETVTTKTAEGSGDIPSRLTGDFPDTVSKNVALDITADPVTINGSGGEDLPARLTGDFPDTVSKIVSLNITADPVTVSGAGGEDLPARLTGDIPDTVSKTVTVEVTAKPVVVNGSGDTAALARENVPVNVTANTAVKIGASYSVTPKLTDSKVKTLAGVKSSYSFSAKATLNVSWTLNGKPPSINPNGKTFRGGIVGGPSSLSSFARGGLVGFSEGGIVRGGSRLIQVAEEGSPEMVIPLSSQRRDRGRKLWEKAGEMLKVPGFAQGGLVDESTLPNVWQTSPAVSRLVSGRRDDDGPDEDLRSYSQASTDASVGAGEVHVEVGGITVNLTIQANGGGNVADAIRAQIPEITDAVSDAIFQSLEGGFSNTPLRGGLAG